MWRGPRLGGGIAAAQPNPQQEQRQRQDQHDRPSGGREQRNLAGQDEGRSDSSITLMKRKKLTMDERNQTMLGRIELDRQTPVVERWDQLMLL